MDRHSDIIAACKKLAADGMDRGASGNVSVRDGDKMMITPSAVGCDVIQPELIASMALASKDGDCTEPNKPSSEWQFHSNILRAPPDINAVVHTHAPYSTILSVAHKPIPAFHHIIVPFSGSDVRVCEYARCGTVALSEKVLAAMDRRKACLMAKQGMVVGEGDLTRAIWLAGELEALAHQYYHALNIGGGVVLSDAEIVETAKGFESYGVQSKEREN